MKWGHLFLGLGCLLLGACGTAADRETPSNEALARGTVIYDLECKSCHGGPAGGNLRDIPPPHNANGHSWHHADQQLAEIIMNGLDFSMEGQQKMPAFRGRLTEEEVTAVLAYIKTMWTPDQRTAQATVTAGWSNGDQ